MERLVAQLYTVKALLVLVILYTISDKIVEFRFGCEFFTLADQAALYQRQIENTLVYENNLV